MKIIKLLATEDMLEVDKVFEKEQLANKSSETSIMLHEIKTDNEQEEKDVTEPSETDNTDAETPTDETDVEYEEKKDTDEVSDTTETEAIESFKLIQYNRLSEEDWKDNVATIGNYMHQAATYIGYLGITYGPTILNHTYKGVVYLMGKIIKLLFVGINNITKYIKRRIQSFKNIKQNITDLKSMITELEKKEELTDLTDLKYSNVNTINILKIGTSVDFISNITALQSFITNTIEQIDKHIKKDIVFIMYLTNSLNRTDLKNPVSLMKVEHFSSDFVNKSIKGYSLESELLDSFTYKNLLPGDTLFISQVPKRDITEFDQIIEAYNRSKMFLALSQDSFESIDSVDYMDKDQILNYLNGLDKLCDVCISHEKIYENIMQLKKQLRFSFKRYFNAIINSKEKVTLKSSLTEYVYLKSMYIDKIYLPASMDIHDYAAKVMTASINYLTDNIKRL